MFGVATNTRQPPLVAHIIFRLDVGGLENGLVNIINCMPPGMFRHAIICITCATSFRNRIKSDDVTIIELNKKPGKGLGIYWRFWRAVRKLKPDIVHTRNVNALEFQIFAAIAGTSVRIHGEHGWDTHDLHGKSWKFRTLRKLVNPFVNQFIVVSEDIQDYLKSSVGVRTDKIALILNGVDTDKFRPRTLVSGQGPITDSQSRDPTVICAVGRLKDVKNHQLLVDAFVRLVNEHPEKRDQYRLLIVGDGPLCDPLIRKLKRAGVSDLSSLPGSSNEVEKVLQSVDIFVSPSKNEGISNTILEAMATQLPVVATKVGGTEEIVQHDVTGILVKNADVTEMADAIFKYLDDPQLRQKHGVAARERVVNAFALDTMIDRYMAVYQQHLN